MTMSSFACIRVDDPLGALVQSPKLKRVGSGLASRAGDAVRASDADWLAGAETVARPQASARERHIVVTTSAAVFLV
jgi:hypothetical protein